MGRGAPSVVGPSIHEIAEVDDEVGFSSEIGRVDPGAVVENLEAGSACPQNRERPVVGMRRRA